MTYRLHLGDCLEFMRTLPDASVDAVITDPPYPCIKRSYGTWTEEEWFALMQRVVPECMRVLKPTGSAVFVLQPNSERVGKMRMWLWEFMLWVGKTWGIVQDVWWWNHTALPTVHCHDQNGLTRPSLKACVWVGPSNCYRRSSEILWAESEGNEMNRKEARCTNLLQTRAGGGTMRDARARSACVERGGVTPFNVLPIGGGGKGGAQGHSAATPLSLCRWWTRYICPRGGVVLDPFSGSGTVGAACLREGRHFLGSEVIPDYHAIAESRLAEEESSNNENLAARGLIQK